MEYYNALEKTYQIFYDLRSGDTSKIEFLSSDVFNFTTYDSRVDTIFGKAMLDVLDAIVTQTCREYQTDYKKYLNFLMMVNTPFLKDKIDWGTSISSPWFDTNKLYDINSWLIQVDIVVFLEEMFLWVGEEYVRREVD